MNGDTHIYNNCKSFKDKFESFINKLTNLSLKNTSKNDFPENKNLLFIILFGIIISIVLIILSILFNLWPAVLLPTIMLLFFILAFVLLVYIGWTKLPALIGNICVLILPPIYQWMIGGFSASGGFMLWAFGSPIAALILKSGLKSWYYLIAFFTICITSIYFEVNFPLPDIYINKAISFFFIIFNSLGFTFFVFWVSIRFISSEQAAKIALNKEHELLVQERNRSEKLLLNILPEQIANQLKSNQGLIAQSYKNVTVLFADIVGFTHLSTKITPYDIVLFLNDIFSYFDDLVIKHGLEKIKTIGDAYMAAAGIPIPIIEPELACANLALEMLDVLEMINKNPLISKMVCEQSINLRIGIHTGQVTAGVIGKNKFIYDLWGDVVNTASRMESHGVPGKIHVTHEVKIKLDSRFEFSPPQSLMIKGKGVMQTYFLLK